MYYLAVEMIKIAGENYHNRDFLGNTLNRWNRAMPI